MTKALRVLVMVEIRANVDDDDDVLTALKDKLLEEIEDDSLDFSVEEEEDD